MPLSDQVRAILAARADAARRPRPSGALPQPAAPRTAAAPPPDARASGARERMRRERERYKLATEVEYWLAFCFPGEDGAARFTRALGVTPADPAGRYLPGPAIEAATPVPDPAERRLRLLRAQAARAAARLPAPNPPDPLAGLPETGSLEADSADELAAILAVMTAPPDPRPADVRHSPYWRIGYWKSLALKEAWLMSRGIIPLGNKYIDGSAAARILGLPGWQ